MLDNEIVFMKDSLWKHKLKKFNFIIRHNSLKTVSFF